MLEPFMPESSEKIKQQLGTVKKKEPEFKWRTEGSFEKIKKPVPIFPKD
jgi:methionyl-tRNA synthetase